MKRSSACTQSISHPTFARIIFEDGADIPKHRLTGIKRSKTAHQHLKTKPRYP